LEGGIESGEPQGQDVEEAGLLPAHARPLEMALNDMLTCPFHGAGTHREPTVPGRLVPDPSSILLQVAYQRGQDLAEGLFPRPHSFERTEDRPDAVREEGADFLLDSGLGISRVVGVLERGEGIEVLAEMTVIQYLTLPWKVSIRHLPNPGHFVPQDLSHRDAFLTGVPKDLFDAHSQVLRRTQHAHIAAGEDPAKRGPLCCGFEPPH
jgi:hypothetical protein